MCVILIISWMCHSVIIIVRFIRLIETFSFLKMWWLWKEPLIVVDWCACLASETVQGAALSLQGVHDIHGGDGLAFGVLAVSDCITDDILEEYLQDSTCFFVYQTWYSLDPTSPGKSSDCRLGNTLDVVSKHLAVTFCASLSEPLSSFSTTRHVDEESLIWWHNTRR